MAEKLFVLVRADLTPGAQISQSIHAVHEFEYWHPAEFSKWRKESNTLAILHVRDEEHLLFLRERAEGRDIPCSIFREPDMEAHATALVLAPCPSAKNLVQKLHLVQ